MNKKINIIVVPFGDNDYSSVMRTVGYTLEALNYGEMFEHSVIAEMILTLKRVKWVNS